MNLSHLSWDLGVRKLLPQWRQLFSSKDWVADSVAGTTVALVAIPLSLAIALASGVSPGTGLITAIVAGIVCALFGGTPLAVSGPAAAMTILIADVVEKFGVTGLILICLIAGVMQLISGIMGLGQLSRYVPLPVIAGFTAGIGVIILIGQLPRAFGLEPPPESHIFDVFSHIQQYFHEINITCLLLVFLTIGIIRGLPKVFPRIPAILPAVLVATGIVYFFNLSDVPVIGEIPRSLPAPRFPAWPDVPFQDLMFNAFIIYVLASLETLLSSSAIDKIARGPKHDSDQELIGQGLGNIAVSLFGGIPVTGVIARSVTNVRSGAKTRRSSIIHSILILLAVYFAAPFISYIPIVALAGVLFSIAFSMISYRDFKGLWLTSKWEAAIYAVTFFTIIFVDLLAGVQAGIIAACLIMLLQLTRNNLHISAKAEDDVIRLSLTGALSFLSMGKIAEIQKKLETKEYQGKTLVLDLSSVTNMDSSGATAVVDLYNYCQNKNMKFYVKGLARRFESLFSVCEGDFKLEDHYLISEHELRKKEAGTAPKSSYGRLVHGVHRYHMEQKQNEKRLFEFITKAQDPHTLFIACSDSRVMPNNITSTDPGELFIVRNVGNFIPPYAPESQHSEGAALEFALSSFDINDIVICGHANCGAMKACRAETTEGLPHELKTWIDLMRIKLRVPQDTPLHEVSKANVLNQIQNLKTYPIVQEKIANGTLNIHGWFFDFKRRMVFEWSEEMQSFVSIVPDVAETF